MYEVDYLKLLDDCWWFFSCQFQTIIKIVH